ncbi:MAG: hypothetical protein JXX28_04065 [Deltaproteobacteria bacterium]|nr:hypothetical protein [Deltaproteobacteria bacterium]
MQAIGRVLFAGLSPQESELAYAALGDDFHTLLTVRDGAELLELCEGDPPDVVLVGEHGADDPGALCRQVRARTQLRTAIIAVARSFSDYSELLEGPLDDVICDPVDGAQLLARVRARRQGLHAVQGGGAVLHQRSVAVRHLAHDVRSPLNAIFLLAEMLAQEDINPDITQDARDILESADMASGLLEGLSGLMRLDSEDDQLSRLRLDLSAAVHKICGRPFLRNHTLVDPGGQVVLLGDQRAISQALGDILINAFFLSERKGRLRVRVSEEGPFAVVRVAHPGITAGQDVFRKLLDSTGTGTVDLRQAHMSVSAVGLSYAAHVARMHGGDLSWVALPEGGHAAVLRLVRSPAP